MKPWLKNRNDKSACDNIFSELLLTDKFRHYLRMNATSDCWLYIDFYTLITYAFYITYTYNYEKHSLLHHILIFKIHYSTHVCNLLFYYAIKTIELMTRNAASFEKVFHRMKFLAVVNWNFLSLKCLMKA